MRFTACDSYNHVRGLAPSQTTARIACGLLHAIRVTEKSSCGLLRGLFEGERAARASQRIALQVRA